MPSPEQLQRSVFKWVQAADDEARGRPGVVRAHQTITAQEVARKYGVPEDKLRGYIKGEIEEEASCKSLPFTFIMFVSFSFVVYWHDPVIPVNDVEDSLTFDVEENANFAFSSPFIGHKGIYDVNSYADFWSWMIKGFIPLVFVQDRIYSEGREADDPDIQNAFTSYLRHRRGLWLNYNKIVGGVRIRQERGDAGECETTESLIPFYKYHCVHHPRDYILYPEKSTAKHTEDPSREFWLWVNEDQSTLLKILEDKEREGWLDRQTRKIEIAIPFSMAI
jgi:hypothetical protein